MATSPLKRSILDRQELDLSPFYTLAVPVLHTVFRRNSSLVRVPARRDSATVAVQPNTAATDALALSSNSVEGCRATSFDDNPSAGT